MANEINVGLAKDVGNAQAKFVLDFEGWTPGGGVSDHVHDGNYELKILSCTPVAKKQGAGVNANIMFIVNGPDGCPDKGKQLVVYHPVPMGDSKAPENRNKRFINNLLHSIISGKRGTEAADGLKGAGKRELSFASFDNQLCYAKVRETIYEGRQVGEIAGYITKDVYLAAPGPFGSAAEVDLVGVKASAAEVAANPAPTSSGNSGSSNPVEDALGL